MPYTGDSLQAQLERLQRRFRVLRGVLAHGRSKPSAEEAILAFLEEVCLGFSWPVGLYFTKDDTASSYQPTAIRFPREGSAHAVRALHERSRAESAALDQDIARRGLPAWIPNVTLEPTFDVLKQAVALGVRGMVAIPIAANGRTFGIAEFFTREEFNPSTDQVEYLSDLGHIMGAMAHFHHLERRALKTREEQELVFEHLQDPVYIIDGTGRATYANEPAARFFGLTGTELRGRMIHDLYHVSADGGKPVPADQCPVHGDPARSLRGVRRKETFRTAANAKREVEAVAAPLALNGKRETIVVLRIP